MSSNFDLHFKGKKVLVVTNDESDGIICATIERVAVVGSGNNVPMAVFKNEAGTEFMCTGVILPDEPAVRALIEAVRPFNPTAKEIFAFLARLGNFRSDFQYAVKMEPLSAALKV